MALEWGIPHADVAQLVERELPNIPGIENSGERMLDRWISIWLCRAVSMFRLRSRFSLSSPPRLPGLSPPLLGFVGIDWWIEVDDLLLLARK